MDVQHILVSKMGDSVLIGNMASMAMLWSSFLTSLMLQAEEAGDDVHSLLYLSPSEVISRVEPLWSPMVDEATRRGLELPDFGRAPLSYHALSADTLNLVDIIANRLNINPPPLLSSAQALRAARLEEGYPLLPVAWMQVMARLPGIYFDKLSIFSPSSPEFFDLDVQVHRKMIIFARVPFSMDGVDGYLLHVYGESGKCYIMHVKDAQDGKPSRSIKRFADMNEYFAYVLSKIVEYMPKRSAGKVKPLAEAPVLSDGSTAETESAPIEPVRDTDVARDSAGDVPSSLAAGDEPSANTEVSSNVDMSEGSDSSPEVRDVSADATSSDIDDASTVVSLSPYVVDVFVSTDAVAGDDPSILDNVGIKVDSVDQVKTEESTAPIVEDIASKDYTAEYDGRKVRVVEVEALDSLDGAKIAEDDIPSISVYTPSADSVADSVNLDRTVLPANMREDFDDVVVEEDVSVDADSTVDLSSSAGAEADELPTPASSLPITSIPARRPRSAGAPLSAAISDVLVHGVGTDQDGPASSVERDIRRPPSVAVPASTNQPRLVVAPDARRNMVSFHDWSATRSDDVDKLSMQVDSVAPRRHPTGVPLSTVSGGVSDDMWSRAATDAMSGTMVRQRGDRFSHGLRQALHEREEMWDDAGQLDRVGRIVFNRLRGKDTVEEPAPQDSLFSSPRARVVLGDWKETEKDYLRRMRSEEILYSSLKVMPSALIAPVPDASQVTMRSMSDMLLRMRCLMVVIGWGYGIDVKQALREAGLSVQEINTVLSGRTRATFSRTERVFLAHRPDIDDIEHMVVMSEALGVFLRVAGTLPAMPSPSDAVNHNLVYTMGMSRVLTDPNAKLTQMLDINALLSMVDLYRRLHWLCLTYKDFLGDYIRLPVILARRRALEWLLAPRGSNFFDWDNVSLDIPMLKSDKK